MMGAILKEAALDNLDFWFETPFAAMDVGGFLS